MGANYIYFAPEIGENQVELENDIIADHYDFAIYHKWKITWKHKKEEILLVPLPSFFFRVVACLKYCLYILSAFIFIP